VPDDPLSFEDDDEDESEPVESDVLPVDVVVDVPVVVSWSARPATATTPTTLTPASPIVTVRARVNPRSRCTGALPVSSLPDTDAGSRIRWDGVGDL
jgi:hypothetical protein